jgi:hypothetical protein
MFHFDPSDELCPFYLQKEGRPNYNVGHSHIKNNIDKSIIKKISATSA